MEKLDKLGKLRKPLEPLPPANGVEDDAYKVRLAKYKELLDEFYALDKLREDAEPFGAKSNPGSGLLPPGGEARVDYVKRFPLYAAAREAYVKENEGFLETIDMVRAKVRRILEETGEEPPEENDKEPPECPMPPFKFDFDSEDKYADALAKYNEAQKKFDEWTKSVEQDTARLGQMAGQIGEYFFEIEKFEELEKSVDKAFEKVANTPMSELYKGKQ